MKLYKEIQFLSLFFVAPRAGAWIETKKLRKHRRRGEVAPRAGAWIETIEAALRDLPNLSRPPRGGVD